MNKMVNIGFGNIINIGKVVSIIRPEAAPVKRMVQNAKDQGCCIDATCGRKCKAVIVTEQGQIVLSALLPETIANRVNLKESVEGNSVSGIILS